MTPIKQGQIVKFHTPLADENPNQLYVVLEVIEDDERPRADIQALNTGLSFPPINTVRLGDLEIVEVETNDLIGHKVTINKSDYSQVEGRVIKVSEQKIEINLSNAIHGVETNVWLTVVDNKGLEHIGTLFVNPTK
jgi:transcription antitermination factor NusG